MKEKITPRYFVDQKFPHLKNVPTNEISNLIDGNTILNLMEEYYLYRNILEKTSKDANNYDYYK